MNVGDGAKLTPLQMNFADTETVTDPVTTETTEETETEKEGKKKGGILSDKMEEGMKNVA